MRLRGIICALAVIALFKLVLMAQETVFKTDVRLVEVYATISDSRGRYVDGLAQERFQILDDGQPQKLEAFETESSKISCAILIDTTGSMQNTLPAVKNAVVRFIDELREGDSAAIFGFTSSVALLQGFTTDLSAAKRAALRIRAAGQTALFDAIATVTHDVALVNGKKAIVVLTDGGDNASMLRVTGAIESAKKAGVPVYTVAEGDALKSHDLMKNLRMIAANTGGSYHEARDSHKVSDIFQEIVAGLAHTYLLAYRPPAADSPARWRTIQVKVSGLKDYKGRWKEGYYPE